MQQCPDEISGLDLARIIKARFDGVAVVLMTGFADVRSDEIAEMCIEGLQKPCPAPELANALHRALHGNGIGTS